MANAKTMANEILHFLITTLLIVTTFLAPYILTAPKSVQATLALVLAGCTLLLALCRAWVGLIPADIPDAAPSATPAAASAAYAAPVLPILVSERTKE